MVVRAVGRAGDVGGVPHLLFIGASERDRLPVLLRQLEGRPVLTVGDATGYGGAGVVLNFYTSDSRIRFEANTTAAARSGLQISSRCSAGPHRRLGPCLQLTRPPPVSQGLVRRAGPCGPTPPPIRRGGSPAGAWRT